MYLQAIKGSISFELIAINNCALDEDDIFFMW